MRFTGSLNLLIEPLGFPQSCALDSDLYPPVTGHKIAVMTVNSSSKAS